ncbi:hypothetical protein BCR34DRAFT_599445 [Clohesyomyces aquaticus]|uniref:DUF7708 domain-containing protein n=1 Tax=Clohesyomyces aquaticus TaxID=1231657 RepID=A0A1Y1ZUU4_9PLEO|nr:hypothetical protein BCR34DRAFT_599445 [Clohesyomyces aquaticus]
MSAGSLQPKKADDPSYAVEIPEDIKQEIDKYAKESLERSETLYRSVAGKFKLRTDVFSGASSIERFQLEESIEKAIVKGKEMDSARKKSLSKKSGTHLVNFANSLRGLLIGYTEMKGIIGGAAPPFSQIAYGGLHVLLFIGINKIRREDSIKDTLDELALAMPRMRNYGRALQGHKQEDLPMRKLLIEVYIAAMEFPKCAIKYYTQKSYKRNLRLVYKPEQMVKEVADRITKAITSISDEAIGGIFVTQRQQGLEMQVVASDTQQIVAAYRKTQENQHRRHIRQLRQNLSLSTNDYVSPTLEDLRNILEGSFSKSPRRAGKKDKVLMELNLIKLLQLPEFKRWQNGPRSSLLVLSGSNYDDHYSRTRLCWLSSAIIEVASNIAPNHGRAVYSPRRVLPPTSTESPQKALSTAVIQLLEADMALCDEVVDMINCSAGVSIKEQIKNLEIIMEHSSASTIYLLFDRIDLFDKHGVSPVDFIISLLRVIKVQGKVVKVLVTAEGVRWKKDEELLASNNGKALRDGLEDEQLILKLQWMQPEAEDSEWN